MLVHTSLNNRTIRKKKKTKRTILKKKIFSLNFPGYSSGFLTDITFLQSLCNSKIDERSRFSYNSDEAEEI